MPTPFNNIRFKIILTISVIIATIITVRYASIMLNSTDTETSRAGTSLVIERGPILDRNGKILAIQTRLHSVSAWTPNIANPEQTAKKLAEILDIPVGEIVRKLAGDPRFVYIKRKITPTESEKIKELMEAGELPGIDLEQDFGRNYPEKDLAAHLIGYVGTDNVGLDGIEYTFNDLLSPKPEDEREEHIFGNQVFLTIDINMQYHMNEIAEEAMAEHDADSVMLLVMDSRSGEILSYTSLPGYDPNNFEKYGKNPRFNRPVSLIYEPGSAFKIFSLASFLQLGGIDINDEFVTNGTYYKEFDNGESYRIKDLANYGRISVEEVIKYSSNVGAAYASETVNADSFYAMLKSFGFGESTGITINGEENGILKEPRNWSARSKPTIAMGQEIGVTAIQMISAASVFANQGVLLRPVLIKKIVSASGKVIEEHGRSPVREVLSPAVAVKMLRMMRSSTENGGTARRASVEGVDISAKTGTAEIWDSEIGDYSKNEFLASCIAIFPTDDPRLIVYVVIKNPKGESYYGGRIAAPIIGKCVEYLVPYTGIPRNGDHVANTREQISVRIPKLPSFNDVVPDFTGLPKRVLLPLFKREDIDVELKGEGWVVKQSPPPGTKIDKGQTIRLELE